MSQSPPISVACIGGAHLDRIAKASGRLVPGSSNPVGWRQSPGGVARNVAATLARLGVRVALFSVLGRDAEGEAILAGLDRLGVGVAGMVRRDGLATASYVAILEDDASLALGLNDGAIYDTLDEAWADGVAGVAGGADFWVVDANLPECALARLLDRKQAATKVFADPVSVAKAQRFEAHLGRFDAVFPDRGEAALLSGCGADTVEAGGAAARALATRGAGVAVVTMGADGLCYAARDAAEAWRHLPAAGGANPVDVTGAGDALIAGTLYGFAQQARGAPNWDRALAHGLGMAAIAVGYEGADMEGLDPATLAREVARWSETEGAKYG